MSNTLLLTPLSSTLSASFTTNHKLVAFFGPSGSGKSTILQHIKQIYPQLPFSVSYTTRTPRIGEKDGQDYYFVNLETFNKHCVEKDIFESVELFGNHYGTSTSQLKKGLEQGHMLLDISKQGIIYLKQHWKNTDSASIDNGKSAANNSAATVIAIFIIAPNLEILVSRLRDRNTDSPEHIAIRVKDYKQDVLEAQQLADFVVVNDDLTKAVAEVSYILKKSLNL